MAKQLTVLEFEKPIVELESKLLELRRLSETEGIDFSDEIKILEQKCERLKKEIYGCMTPWQRVQLARHPQRPYSMDYIPKVFDDFIEIHGDRNFADDASLVCGAGYLNDIRVMVIAHQKGRDIQECMARNFGMSHPEGYRKARRIMQIAGKYGFPLICFIDTPGAYPGIGAEERGQATAIAENLREMALLPVPLVSIVIGEGGSGGALAIGVTDRILILENAYYSVISPEGCAAILFRDSRKAPDASVALKITARDLKELGVVDEIVPEPFGGAHRDYDQTAGNIKSSIERHVRELRALSPEKLLSARLSKFRNIGAYALAKERKTTLRKKNRKEG